MITDPLRVSLTANALDDLQHWQRADPALHQCAERLIENIRRDPHCLTGRPVQLKISGRDCNSVLWSRTLRGPRRLVYELSGAEMIVHQCRF